MADVINVEPGIDWVAKSGYLRHQRAELEGGELQLRTVLGALLGLQNEALAHFKSGLHRVEHFVRDKTILV